MIGGIRQDTLTVWGPEPCEAIGKAQGGLNPRPRWRYTQRPDVCRPPHLTEGKLVILVDKQSQQRC
jgi:hypothetical protein